ncbi:hypothetical protein [Flavobacterium piscis]|uniref:Uncharacterized protein n=1 Tax=Flavobacterium piscis TaxID=1114874 RepID=A0ABU1YB68_9FLAO|nr:hypothetical protein [Flavobacterium piscis]MDR7211482.1 hypothetical protein [Flavobacterium piscis]
MKKYIQFLLIISFLVACGQEKKEDAMNIEERIKFIEKKITKYDYEPLYQINVETMNCFEILINGFPVYTHNQNIPGIVKFNINSALLKSGKQNLEIVILPSYKNDNTQNEYLSNSDSFSLEIEQTAWDKYGSLEESKKILHYELEERDKLGEKIEYNNLKEYSQKILFDAKIPYELKGWNNSQDLSKIDKELLKEQVLSFYKKVIKSFEIKDYDNLNTLFLNADTEWYQSEYFSLNIIKKYQNKEGRKGKSISTIKSNSNVYELKMFLLDNYKLGFYCDNKVVRLEFAKGPNKGNSVFGYEDIDRNGLKRQIFIDMFLHIPKEKKELEIVR